MCMVMLSKVGDDLTISYEFRKTAILQKFKCYGDGLKHCKYELI